MAKPKAPRWLTQAFADGVDRGIVTAEEEGLLIPAYPGADSWCWLAHHDPAQRPCSGPVERFHFCPRQRVENALGALLPDNIACPYCLGRGEQHRNDGEPEWRPPLWNPLNRGGVRHRRPCEPCEGKGNREALNRDAILLAAWDPRNGGIGCEHHHRRFDGHATSPRAPKIVVPFPQLPSHVYDYVDDFGFRGSGWLTERFPA